uniref:Uncharacterized protein n=1 Tax=Dictyoglomus turgidum TaxID=513050 RepID=A0A7C3SQL3_9BACT
MMSKIKLSENFVKEINYPIKEYEEDLVFLIKEIQERQSMIYKVPYEELDEINVVLDSVPEESIDKFNEKYSYIQACYNRVSYILMQVKKEMKIWNYFRNRVNTLYRKAKNLLLVNNPDIKNLRNKELQEAAIQSELSALVDLVEGLDSIMEDLKFDSDIVTLKLDTLDKANLNLNRQQKIVENEIMLGMIPGVRQKE